MHKNCAFNTFLVVVLNWLFVSSFYAQPDCSNKRYIDRTFAFQFTPEPEIYATAPDIPSIYLGESVTFPQDLSFDFYNPVLDSIEKRPLIIMAFGGSFLGGSKRQEELRDYCEEMALRGFCVASIDYRIHFNVLSTSSSIRAVYRGLQDFRAAVRFFRHNADAYGIDPDLIFAGGNSAGAINAIQAAYVDESDRTMSSIFAATFENGSDPDLGCIDCSGNAFTESSIPNGVVNLWGGIGELFWIEGDEAPIISFHGLDDTTVSPNSASPFGFPIFPVLHGSIPIHAQIDLVGIPNELNTYPGRGHELWTNPFTGAEIADESGRFLLQFIKSAPPMIMGDTLVCSDSTYTYIAQDPQTESKYCWDVVNGTIVSSTDTSVTVHWHSSLGLLQLIELNAYDAQSDPTVVIMDIDPGVLAYFNSTNVEGVTSFTSGSTGAVEYFWDFGDGATSTSSNPTHTYELNGAYLVTLMVTGPCGEMGSFSNTVFQNCQPTLNIETDPTTTGVYQAAETVISDKPLAAGANVTFIANDLIDLQDGFLVNEGDAFEVVIEVCVNE